MPYQGPETNVRVFASKTPWRHIEDEDKERAAAAVMSGLGLSDFVKFEGPWFYMWLMKRARKNLSEERIQELMSEANQAEREAHVDFQAS